MRMGTVIGKNIAARRMELNLTQEDLAKRLGYKSKSTINKIELGINDITQTKIISFAKALETTPSILLGWDDEENERLGRIAKSSYAKDRLSDKDEIIMRMDTLNEDELKRLKDMIELMFPKKDK